MVRETKKVVVVAAALMVIGVGTAALRAWLGQASATKGDASWLAVLDLARLPAQAQKSLAILLLLPLGALVAALVRNVVGIATFGTFAPVLLGVSFAYCDPWTGAAVFAAVMLAGLGGRWLLGKLPLLMVPRLGVLLTLVVLALAAVVSILHQFGSQVDQYAILLPLVAATMVVERFFICQEEDGSRLAWSLMLGTLAVAAACLGLLKSQALGRLVVRFPELLLCVAALLLLVGRYSGYRLSELVRFRDVRGSARWHALTFEVQPKTCGHDAPGESK